MTPPRSGGARRGSLPRLIVGVALIIGALVTTVTGFITLIRVLEADGYGSPAQRNALVILGAAGALMSAGIATVIWEVAERHRG